MSAPVEAKVKYATWAAAVASLIVGYVVLHVPALKDLSEYMQIGLVTALTTLGTYVAGYWAKHTPRLPSQM